MLNWVVNPIDVFNTLFSSSTHKIETEIYLLCDRYAAEMESWMKANALWEDQTGNARQTLYTAVHQLSNAIVLEADHGVEYGYWLEYSNMGLYEIIGPALDEFAPRLFADIQRLLS